MAVGVSWLFVGAYVTFVAGASLFVGLMNPLVNLPTCDNSNARVAVELAKPDEMIPRNWPAPGEFHQMPARAYLEEEQQIGKREAVQTNAYEEKVNTFRQNHESTYKNHWLYKQYEDVASRDVFDICEELTNPISGFIYPWYLPRLPTNIKPINYNVELLLNDFDLPIGSEFGYITAKFNVLEATNFILIHSAINDVPFVDRVLDKDDNVVNISCTGQFPFIRNDYFIIKTVENMTTENGPYTVRFLFFDQPIRGEEGIFALDYGGTSPLIATKFEPLDARRAYPIFDEPGLKATYDFLLYHRNDYITLTNTPLLNSTDSDGIANTLTSTYVQTPAMPSYLIAFISFNKNDFGSVSREINTANGPVPLTIWARNVYIDNGFANDTLDMCEQIFIGLLDVFRGVNDLSAIPPKIDVIAIPDYPVDAIGHFGLPVFKENKILFKLSTASERDKQNVAFLIAKTFATFWLGNYVTFPWWSELWTTEGLGSFLKYKAIEEPFGEWNIETEFITEELVPALISDGYPSSHPTFKNISNPYEIEEYFDDIESSKPAAIFRWLEAELGLGPFLAAVNAYLNANPWGVGDMNDFYNAIDATGLFNWPAKDFFDRWTIQSNFPLVRVEVTGAVPTQQVTFTQFRSLNTNFSIFAGNLLYPSPYGFVWYIPMRCEVGTGPLTTDDVRIVEFFLDQRTDTRDLPAAPSGQPWQWINCDKDFTGFFECEYTDDNVKAIGEALEAGNKNFEPEDRANIIHNLFLNAFSERGTYFQVRDVLDFLAIEDDFLPWRTAFIHLNNLASVLQYKKPFYQIATWFGFLLRTYEQRVDIWNATDVHIENLLRETVGTLACFLQDDSCLRKTPELWEVTKPFLSNGDFASSPVAAYAREIVYNYHIQNTYDVDDWDQILFDYDNIADSSESRKLLEALTFTRLPWLLARTQTDPDYFKNTDFFGLFKLLSQSSVGRELTWDFFRTNYNDIINDYTQDDARVGQLLLDITKTFETEFLFNELLAFVFNIGTGATANARFKAIEIVSTNVVWLADKEKEIMEAFAIGRAEAESSPSLSRFSKYLEPKKSASMPRRKSPSELIASMEKEFKKRLAETKLEMFDSYKAKLL